MSNPAKGQHGDGQRHSTMSAQEQKAVEVQEAGAPRPGPVTPKSTRAARPSPRPRARGTPSRRHRIHRRVPPATRPRVRRRSGRPRRKLPLRLAPARSSTGADTARPSRASAPELMLVPAPICRWGGDGPLMAPVGAIGSTATPSGTRREGGGLRPPAGGAPSPTTSSGSEIAAADGANKRAAPLAVGPGWPTIPASVAVDGRHTRNTLMSHTGERVELTRADGWSDKPFASFRAVPGRHVREIQRGDVRPRLPHRWR